MAKKKQTADELRSLAEQLISIADRLEPETKAEPKEISYTDVRKALADKSRAGHTAEIREILTKHGAGKLSEIDPKEYAAILKEAEVL
ncbi:hypothetical protein [Mogibacterium timidum]